MTVTSKGLTNFQNSFTTGKYVIYFQQNPYIITHLRKLATTIPEKNKFLNNFGDRKRSVLGRGRVFVFVHFDNAYNVNDRWLLLRYEYFPVLQFVCDI